MTCGKISPTPHTPASKFRVHDSWHSPLSTSLALEQLVTTNNGNVARSPVLCGAFCVLPSSGTVWWLPRRKRVSDVLKYACKYAAGEYEGHACKLSLQDPGDNLAQTRDALPAGSVMYPLPPPPPPHFPCQFCAVRHHQCTDTRDLISVQKTPYSPTLRQADRPRRRSTRLRPISPNQYRLSKLDLQVGDFSTDHEPSLEPMHGVRMLAHIPSSFDTA